MYKLLKRTAKRFIHVTVSYRLRQLRFLSRNLIKDKLHFNKNKKYNYTLNKISRGLTLRYEPGHTTAVWELTTFIPGDGIYGLSLSLLTPAGQLDLFVSSRVYF